MDNDISEEFNGEIELHIPRSLHKELVLRAREEGVDLELFVIYLLARELGREK